MALLPKIAYARDLERILDQFFKTRFPRKGFVRADSGYSNDGQRFHTIMVDTAATLTFIDHLEVPLSGGSLQETHSSEAYAAGSELRGDIEILSVASGVLIAYRK